MENKMASESGKTATSMKRATSKANDHDQPEQLPCPRCDSTNTKFCYYNNYNFSQPRHFCKSCRRYWTHGGTLRDIPVGGSSRKTAKRYRNSSSSYSSTSTTATPFIMGSSSTNTNTSSNTLLLPLPTTSPATTSSSNVNVIESFTSLLNTPGPTGYLELGGFGLGLGLDDNGCFGLGRGIGWAFSGHMGEDGNSDVCGMVGNGGASVGNTWQFESGEDAFIGVGHVGGGDCFSWPDLSISTPGNGLK